MKNIQYANINQKKAEVVLLLPDRVDFIAKNIMRDKESNVINEK